MKNLKNLLFLGVISLAMLSFTGILQDEWVVPDKYQNMKNPTDPEEDLSIGKSLYSKHCQSCHGKEGYGDGKKANEVEGDLGDFSSEEFQAQSDGALFYKTTFGREDMPEYTKKMPDDEDRFLKQKHELMAEVDVLLGGRAAEEIFIKEISTGAGNDLDRATAILKDMISVYGMTDVAGLMVLSRSQNSFLGGGAVSTDYSEKMAEDMDNYIRTTLNERYNFVKKTLTDYHQAIENMTAVLLDVEVIEGKKVRSIIEDFEKENNMESRLAHTDKIAKAEAWAKEQEDADNDA